MTGHSHFGHWIEDKWGLPAFECTYRPELYRKRKRFTWGFPPLWHQIGNHRIHALVATDGVVRPLSSEKNLWWLNRYRPSRGELGGGIGFITDGEEDWTIFYPKRPLWSDASRVLGIGYTTTHLRYRNIDIHQWIYSPYGDHPFLISEIDATNLSAQIRHLKYFEYWSGTPTLLRPFLGDRGSALSLSFQRKMASYLPDLETLILKPLRPHGPILFLSALPGTWVNGFDSSTSSFFGVPKNLEHPKSVSEGDCQNSLLQLPLINTPWTSSGCLVLQTSIPLNPGESARKRFAFGYAFTEEDLFDRINKIRILESNLFERTLEQWKERLPVFQSKEETPFSREVRWRYFHLQSSFIQKPKSTEVLSTGNYLYKWGFRGLPSRQAQAIVPMNFVSPKESQEALIHLLGYIRDDGRLPSTIHGSEQGWGYRIPSPYPILWSLYALSQGGLLHRNQELLHKSVATPLSKSRNGSSIQEIMRRLFRHLRDDIRWGPHGLLHSPRRGWMSNPLLMLDHFRISPPEKKEESITATSLAIIALESVLDFLDFMDEKQLRSEIYHWTSSLRKNLRQHWIPIASAIDLEKNSIFLSRLFFPLGILREVGDESLFKRVVEEILRTETFSPLGPPVTSKASWKSEHPTGEGSNGGVWPLLNAFWVKATSQIDPNLGWKEFKKMTLDYHTELYPHLWCGTLSGPESYNTLYSEHPGDAWDFSRFLRGILPPAKSFPALDLSNTAGTLMAFLFLLGIQPTAKGLKISPRFPWTEWEWYSPVVGIKFEESRITGYWKPLFLNRPAQLEIELPQTWNEKRGLRTTVQKEKTPHTLSKKFLTLGLPATQSDRWEWEIRL